MSTLSEEGKLRSEPEAVTEISLERRFFRLETLISFLVAFAIIYILITRLEVDFRATWERVRASDPLIYILAFLLYYLSFPLRALRWRIFLRNVGFHEGSGVHLPSFWGLVEIILLSWFANCIVPAKLGDAYRAYLLKKNIRVSFSKTAGTILAERITDMVVLFGLLAGSALGLLGGKNTGTALGVVELGLGMVLLIAFGLLAMGRFGGLIQRLLPRPLKAIYYRFQEGTLQSFRQVPLVLLLSVLVWICEAGRFFLVTRSMGLPLSLPLVVFVALASSLLTTVPFTPGGLGLVEAGVTGLLMIAVSKESALSLTLLDRGISYWSLIVLGFLLFLVSRRK